MSTSNHRARSVRGAALLVPVLLLGACGGEAYHAQQSVETQDRARMPVLTPGPSAPSTPTAAATSTGGPAPSDSAHGSEGAPLPSPPADGSSPAPSGASDRPGTTPQPPAVPTQGPAAPGSTGQPTAPAATPTRSSGAGSTPTAGPTIPAGQGTETPAPTRTTAPTSVTPTRPPAASSTPPETSTPPPAEPTTLDALGGPGSGPVTMGGRSYPNSISAGACTSLATNPAYGFDLQGRYQRLSAVAGQDDDSASRGDVQRITVTGDGRVLAARTVRRGSASTIDVDVAGVRRLTVRFTEVSCSGTDGSAAVLGNARLR